MDDETRRVAAEIGKLERPVALLEALFASAPFPLQLYDATGRSILTNRAFRETYRSEPPPGYNVLRDEVARATGLTELIERAFSGETITTPPHWYDPNELEHVSVVGARRVGQVVTMVPLLDSAGRVAHVAVFAKDVTAELTAQEESETAKTWMTALADVSALMMSTLGGADIEDRLIELLVPQLCDAASAMLMSDDGSLSRIASAGSDAVSDAAVRNMQRRDAMPIPDEFSDVARTGKPLRTVDFLDRMRVALPADSAYLAQLERLAPRDVIIAPIRIPDRVTGIIVLGMTERSGRNFTDEDLPLAGQIGERIGIGLENARLYRALKESEHRALLADRRKDEFLAMLGHELRNPLAPIVTALELMRLRGPSSDAREQQTIERQVKHMNRLVDDLLDLSRITRGDIELERKRIDISTVVSHAIELTNPLFEQRRHRVDVDVASDTYVVADPGRLTQVVGNLLHNAAKFTPEGGQLGVRARRDGDEITLSVSDNGVGFEVAHAAELFELFTRGEAGAKLTGGGLGIGLALVKNLVEIHGGHVSARSEGRNRGSTFFVYLPAAHDGSSEGGSDRSSELKPAPKARRVLVIDDNHDAAEMLAEALRWAGHDVVTADDGAQGLDAVERHAPEVAIVDIDLPIMDGYEFARRVRQEVRFANIKLLALTGYGQETDRNRALASGFDRHFVKPAELDVLLAAVSDT